MLGIVILNFNTFSKTIMCINSIIANIKIDYHIYLVDNKSEDLSGEKLLNIYSNYKSISVILAKNNGGYSYGNNLGITRAITDKADVVLIANSDVIFKNNSIEEMYNSILLEESIGIVGPRIKSRDNKDMQFFRRKLTYYNNLINKKPICSFSNILKLNNNREICHNMENSFIFYGMVSGCCFMIKTKVLKLIGLLDENVFLFHEEDILAYKMESINLYTKYEPKAIIIHDHSSAISKKGSAFERYHRSRSSIYVLKKYAKTGKIELIITSILILSSYMVKSILDKTYKKRFRKLYKEVKKIYDL